MKTTTSLCAVLALLVLCVASCQKPEEGSRPYEGTAQSAYLSGKRAQFVKVPAGTTYIPGEGMAPADEVVLSEDGTVIFIDEQPSYDWAHSFQLVYVVTGAETPRVLFHGMAMPTFTFRHPDGSTITNWDGYGNNPGR